MAENKISIEIPAAEYQAIMEHLNNAQAALSKYVIALTPAQRMGLPKLGDKTLAFVNKTAEYANSQSKFVPSYLDKAEWDKDIKAFGQLTNLLALSNQITSTIADTAMLAGSEAYVNSLSFYNNVKQANKMNEPSAKPIYEDLSQRFPGRITKAELNK
jgi:hypothetical protein